MVGLHQALVLRREDFRGMSLGHRHG
jgi:hypothetical protein